MSSFALVLVFFNLSTTLIKCEDIRLKLKPSLYKWLPMNFLIHAGMSTDSIGENRNGKKQKRKCELMPKSFIEMWKFSTSQQEFLFKQKDPQSCNPCVCFRIRSCFYIQNATDSHLLHFIPKNVSKITLWITLKCALQCFRKNLTLHKNHFTNIPVQINNPYGEPQMCCTIPEQDSFNLSWDGNTRIPHT